MFYYTNKDNKIDVWGNTALTSDVKSFIVTGYVTDSGTPIASNKIVLFCTVQPDNAEGTQKWTLITEPGEHIALVQEGVGQIISLNDPGTRVRILQVK